MNTHSPKPRFSARISLVLMLGLWVIGQTGCAQLRLPRIDPSGNSIFLPAPNSTGLIRSGGNPGTAGVGAINPIFQPAPAQPLAPQTLPQSAGANNIDPLNRGIDPLNGMVDVTPQTPAPTVLSGPRPAPPAATRIEPAFQLAPTPPPCNAKPVSVKRRLTPDPNRRLTPGQAGQMVMSPSKIIAPVGSEVVVIAGVCGPDRMFLKNQPLEWRLAPESVGEFIEVGGTQHELFNRVVPPTSKLLTPTFAKGRTGLKRLVLSRGTPTPTDDIELAEGQTYVTVSSPSPGVSYVTGIAPKAEGWDLRRAITTIHWVDANWAIPVPQSTTAGTVTPLTTLVTRADGSGVADWTVRYSIVGGAAAEFAPAGSQTAETKSNSRGQATVQIRQPINQFEPGTTQVRVDVVRPPIAGQPELVVESGITSITWSAPALTIRAIGPRTTERDTPFNYRVEISNPGDQVARDVVVRAKDLADSLAFISATPKASRMMGRLPEWSIGDIAPNATPKVIDVQLRSDKLGNVKLCFDVTSDSDGLQTEACAETEIVQPCLAVEIVNPRNARPGEPVRFEVQVKNQCNESLSNVTMEIAHDAGLERPGVSNPSIARIEPDGILNVGDTLTLDVNAIARGTGTQCITVTVSADGVRSERKTGCVTVQGEAFVPTDPTPGLPNRPAANPLRMEVSPGPAFPYDEHPEEAVGSISMVRVRLTNQGPTPLTRLALQGRPSDSLRADYILVEPQSAQGNTTRADGEVLTTIEQINPGQTITVDYALKELAIAPDGGIEFSVTAPSGIGSGVVDSIRVPSDTAADPNAAPPRNRDSNAPNFNDNPVGIPGDDLPIILPNDVQGPLTVSAMPVQPTVQRGQPTKVAFIIRNNSRQPLTNLNIDFFIPNTLVFGPDQRLTNTRGLRILPGNRLEGVASLAPGETIEGEIELLAGNLPGQATLQIRAKADQTPLIQTNDATISIQ